MIEGAIKSFSSIRRQYIASCTPVAPKECPVKDFVELAFSFVDIKIEWSGSGLKEIGKNSKNGNTLVKIDSMYFRPAEVDYLRGDYSKAKKILGWKPKISFKELVKEMVEKELQNI